MKASSPLSALLACAGLAQAQLRFSFSRQSAVPTAPTERIRADTPSASLWKNQWTYVVNASIGTPGQDVSLVLSPSTSDTWVIDTNSDYCGSYSDYCVYGTFNSKRSSSFALEDVNTVDSEDYYSYNDGGFYVSGADGTYGSGLYFRDTLTLGGVEVSGLSMGLVNSTNKYIGMLGIGYNDSTFDNFPDRLLEQGLINTTAYSIWLDDADASAGSILFGAIDPTKFDGTLARIDASQSSSSYSYGTLGFTVDLYSINGTSNSSTLQNIDSNQLPFSVIVSPSDTVSNLPSVLAEQIWAMVGATYDEYSGAALIPCSARNASNSFTFALGDWDGPVITATMEDLVIPQDQITSDSYYGYDDVGSESLCTFGIQNGSYYYSSGYWNFGSTLLRRSYTVFDLVNSEVAFAPVKFGVADEAVVPFATYGAVAPSATKVCPATGCSTNTPTSTRRPGTYGGSGSSSSDGSGSSSSSDGTTEFGDGSNGGLLSVGAVVGAAIGAAAGALVIGGIVIAVIRSRRKKTAEDAAEKGTLAPSVSDAGVSDVAEPARAHTQDGFLAPPLPRRPAAAGHVPSIEVTPATAHAVAHPTTAPPAVPAPTETAPEVPAAGEEQGESSKGKEPER